MVAGFSATCVKYLFFTFNFLVFITGGAILGLSLWGRYDDKFRGTLDKALKEGNVDFNVPELNKLHTALLVLAVLGGILLICGFLGCCGACCESPCLLGMFVFVMLALFFAEIAAGTYILVKKGDIKEGIRDALKKLYTSENTNIQKTLHDFEDAIGCCAPSGCGLGDGGKIACCLNIPPKPGCTDILYEKIANNFTIVAYVAVSLAILEVMAMLFACFLCSSIRSNNYSYY